MNQTSPFLCYISKSGSIFIKKRSTIGIDKDIITTFTILVKHTYHLINVGLSLWSDNTLYHELMFMFLIGVHIHRLWSNWKHSEHYYLVQNV